MIKNSDKFDNVLIKLNSIVERGNNISGKVNLLINGLKEPLNGLNIVLNSTAKINELVKRMKMSLYNLQNTNKELQDKLSNSSSVFDSKMNELKSSHESELEQLRNSLVSEKDQLESSFNERSNMSQEDKESALQEIEKAAREQLEAVEKAHEEERNKLIAHYDSEYDSLIQALTNIAVRQAEAINKIDDELKDSEELTNEFASVQNQIIGLLASISELLNDTSGQSLQLSEQPAVQQALSMPIAPTSPIQLENLLAPEEDLENLENSRESIPEKVSNVPTNIEELFKFMLRTLAQRARTGLENNLQDYEKLKTDLKNWKLNSLSNTNDENLKRQKLEVYRLTDLLFNKTNNIYPISSNLTLQTGGRKTRRYRKVRFNTRGKKAGKRVRKSYKVSKRRLSKRSGGKHSIKH